MQRRAVDEGDVVEVEHERRRVGRRVLQPLLEVRRVGQVQLAGGHGEDDARSPGSRAPRARTPSPLHLACSLPTLADGREPIRASRDAVCERVTSGHAFGEGYGQRPGPEQGSRAERPRSRIPSSVSSPGCSTRTGSSGCTSRTRSCSSGTSTAGSAEAFTPDFFLPDLDLYVECTVMRQARTNRKRRKVLRTRREAGVSVEILYRHDLDRLARRWRLHRLLRVVLARRSVV